LGDVVEESDGDLMGEGVNIAARLESICGPGAICLSEQAYWQVKGRLDLAVSDLGPTQLKNIAEPIRVYSLKVGVPTHAKPATGAQSSGSPQLGGNAPPPRLWNSMPQVVQNMICTKLTLQHVKVSEEFIRKPAVTTFQE
jgi:adenylate cyclase